ncbi:MAG: hypothetical protein J6N71_07590 [Muribaculaceae bacterium]|nr:hypothetical protein [Muribaculaceae bacterium]
MVTFSNSKINVNITVDLKLPTGWEDLTDKQLRFFFGMIAFGMSSAKLKAYCLFKWSGLQVVHKYGNDWFCKLGKQKFVLTVEQVEQATHALDWLDNVPSMPVRISQIGKYRALKADFEGVPFETFIVCDNLYQGYLATRQDELLEEIAAHLYNTKRIKLTAAERVSVFYWFASLKGFLAKVFRHFFQPAAGANGADGNMIEHGGSQYEMLQNAVNAQIRALTKGDITKEKEVLSLDTWRALTELDAQAHEYEELNRKFPTK